METKISTGAKVLDDLLNGGLERGIITTIFGHAGSGKSNISMLTALSTAAKGKRVVFIDTENSLSAERIKQLEPQRYKAILKNLIILEPTNFDEQKKFFSQLPELVATEKPELIIVDSIAMLYRLQLGAEEVYETNREMANQLAILSEIARKKNIPILVTNQVYTDFKTENVKMVGGDLLKYWSKCIIKLENVNGFRRASIWKHRSLPAGKEVFFSINNAGLFEVPKPKKKFSLFG
ncbi:MAG: DNA repair and recombination protein RadB [Candidatus Nanoarchaeia archaeon]